MKLKTKPSTCPRCGNAEEVIAKGQLRKAREAAGMTLAQLADSSGYGIAQLSRVELGQRRATLEMRALYESLTYSIDGRDRRR